MTRNRGSFLEPCSMLRILTFASLFTCVFNVSVLIVCVATGRWVFGEAMCQIFAFLSHVTVGGAAWLVAITGLERYYKLFAPAELQCVFSDINTRIIVIGLYLLIACIVTSPLYGWGEYAEFRGYFHLTITLGEAGAEQNVNTPFSGNSSTDSLSETSVSPATDICAPLLPDTAGAHELNLTDFTQIIQSSISAKWGIRARLWRFGQNITYLMRAQSVGRLEEFIATYNDGSVGQYLLSSTYNKCDCAIHSRFLCKQFFLDFKEIEDYKAVYLPFQSPMICSVDFTTVNHIGTGWLVFFILTTAVMPYGVMLILTCVIVLKRSEISIEAKRRDCVNTARLIVGTWISVLLYLPYFVVNIANSNGNYVSPVSHVTVLVLYFSCFLVPCLISLDRNPFRKHRSSSSRTPQSNIESVEDVEFELLQSAPV